MADPTPRELPPRRRRWRWILAALVVSALGLFLARRPLLNAVPPLLVVADPEEPADAIVVLAGDQGERVEHAVLLWKRGLSRTGLLLCSGGRVYHKATCAAMSAAHVALW